MMPETAATQNVDRAAYFKSNSGSRTVACRQKNATPEISAIANMTNPVDD